VRSIKGMATPKQNPVEHKHRPRLVLPDGRVLEPGDQFTVRGEGKFTFSYEYVPDGSVTAYGPVNSQDAMWRSFHPDRVSTVHRKKAEVRP
jgi:hypothetical protein